MPSSQPFKECKICRVEWLAREDFLNDPDIVLVGYQANFVALEKGLFLFNHSCHSTLSVDVRAFADLYDGPVFSERKTGSQECPEYCLHSNNLEPCPAHCECAYVREVIALLKNRFRTVDQAV